MPHMESKNTKLIFFPLQEYKTNITIPAQPSSLLNPA